MKKLILLCSISLLFLSCIDKKSSADDKASSSSTAVTNVDIINGIYTSIANGDFEGFLAALDEKIIWNEAENHPYDDGNPYIGHEALSDLFARVGGEWDDFAVIDLNTYDMVNNMVLITGKYSGSFKKTGKSINAQVAHLWTLKNNKVVQFQQYTDTKQINDAMLE